MVKKRAIMASVLMVILLGSWVAAPGEQGRPMRGQAIYDEYCFHCHGMKGQGDGPEARIQIVPPANFQSPRSRAKADFELLTIVSYGIAFSPMHGFRGRLTDDELLEVIDYIRTMAPFLPLT